MMVNGDRARFIQILTNLLTNAIKFTHQGEIVVEERIEEAHESGSHIIVRVRDTGIGMSPETAATLFDAFTGRRIHDLALAAAGWVWQSATSWPG